MNFCPLIFSKKQYSHEVPCMGEDCILWDSNKDNCLIGLALLNYTHDIPAEKIITREDELEAQIKTLKQQLQAVSMGFPVMNFNTEYKTGLNTAKYPPDPLIGGDTISTINKDWSGLQGGL